MVFVPMVAPTRGDPPSARAQDLGRRLKAEVEKFEAQYPGTSRKDLRDAAAMAIGEESVTVPPRRRVAAVVVALIAGLGVAGVVINVPGDGTSPSIRMLVMSIGVAAACAGVAVAVLRTRQR